MMPAFKEPQYRVLVNFCQDIAKGLVLASAVNQSLGSAPFLIRLLNLISGLSLALLFLYFALLFSQELKQ